MNASASDLLAEARLLRRRRRYADAVVLLESAVHRAEEEEGSEGPTVGEVLIELSLMRVIAHRGDAQVREACVPLAERGVAITRSHYGLHDRRLGHALRILGTHQATTRPDEARASLEGAIGILDQFPDEVEAARLARQWFCDVALRLGRYAEAYEAALGWIAKISRDEQDRFELLSALQITGKALLSLNKPDEAMSRLEEALHVAEELDRSNGTTTHIQPTRKLLEEAKAAGAMRER